MSVPAAVALKALTHNFNPTVFHYYKKEAITRSLVTGSKELALCGALANVSVAATGTTDSNEGSVVCPLCQLLMDMIMGGAGESR